MNKSIILGFKGSINSSIIFLINGSGLVTVPGIVVEVGEGVGIGKVNGLLIMFVGLGRGVVVTRGVGVGVAVGVEVPPDAGIAGVPVRELETVPSPAALTALILIV